MHALRGIIRSFKLRKLRAYRRERRWRTRSIEEMQSDYRMLRALVQKYPSAENVKQQEKTRRLIDAVIQSHQFERNRFWTAYKRSWF